MFLKIIKEECKLFFYDNIISKTIITKKPHIQEIAPISI